MSSDTTTCWACRRGPTTSIFSVSSIPLSSLILMDTAEEAVSFPRGSLDLVVCRNCGFIFNRDFRPEAVDYTLPYESSQDFSPRFRAFKQELIDHLIDDYSLAGKKVLEIGCGDASFLEALCQQAKAVGFCIDPTFDPDRLEDTSPLSGVAEFYDSTTTHLDGDLICCRHTLEHIQPVSEFVALVRESAEHRDGTVVFFEVPDTDRILDEGAFWDVYYEHCSYFTLTSLARLFESQGFRILRLTKGYEDQYLLIDCDLNSNGQAVERPSVTTVLERAESFRVATDDAVRDWKRLIEDANESGETIVLWGASSKAVAFIASMDSDESIAAAVDINPFKQDKYLPGSGHLVCSPEKLTEIDPDLVIVMNPIYTKEIEKSLAEIGLSPRVIALGEGTP